MITLFLACFWPDASTPVSALIRPSSWPLSIFQRHVNRAKDNRTYGLPDTGVSIVLILEDYESLWIVTVVNKPLSQVCRP